MSRIKRQLVCKKCGRNNVQLACWVYPNTNEVIGFYSEDWRSMNGVTYCEDCEEDTGIEEREIDLDAQT